jgi:uncharacterized protein (TIGR03437 family)
VPHGIVNVFTFTPFGLPNGSIARGSVFTIFGQNLGPTNPVTLAGISFPLPLTLGGVAISVFRGGTSISAVPIYVSAGQVNAIMPSNAPLGKVSVQITFTNFKSNPAPVTVVNDSFGIISANGTGQGPGLLQDFVADVAKLPSNTFSKPAKPGQTVIMYGTGLGPVNYADNIAPQQANLPTQVEVWVGGEPAKVQYSGRSPCCSGLDEIVFKVPANAPAGCWVPVQVRTSGVTPSNIVTMAISAKGSACADSENPYSEPFIKGGNMALLSLIRLSAHEDVGVEKPVDAVRDGYYNSITHQTSATYAFLPFLSEPPPGTCTTYEASGDFLSGDDFFGDASAPTLDFGQLSVMGPKGSMALTGNLGQGIVATFGSSVTGYNLPDTTYLVPGAYTFTGKAGAQVGAVKATATMPSPFTWNEQLELNMVDRTKPLMLSWSGTPHNQNLAIFGFSVDRANNSSAAFYCIAPLGAKSFNVPPQILESLPVTHSNPAQSRSGIYVANTPLRNSVKFNASGLNYGAARAVLMLGKTVVFK